MRDVQSKLSQSILVKELSTPVELISGVDVCYFRKQAVAVITTLDVKENDIIDITTHHTIVVNEYNPGFLAFRELPVFLKVLEKLPINPDIVIFDGHGRIHPRRIGLASHASLFIDKPTIGVAKNPFIGQFKEPDNERGKFAWITEDQEVLGVALRTQKNSKPVFVSVGNLISLQHCIDITLELTQNTRIPLVSDLADREGREFIHKIVS
jgi:deoxyribonuclease V